VSATEVAPTTASDALARDDRPPVAPETSKDRAAKRARAVHAPKPAPRTTRVVLRRLDPWTVLKLSVVYYLALFAVLLVAGTLLWAGASAVGVIGNIESFMVDIGFEDFRFIPSKLLGGLALGGLILVVAGTVANVLLTALFNLMSDVVGGLKLTLQEDAEPGRSAEPGKSSV
jgi:uncharacterized membrane protein